MNETRTLAAKAEPLAHTERAVREDLAAGHRLAARFGMTDLIYNHFSARMPGTTDRFLISPYGRWFHEVTASDIVEVDGEGHVIGDAGLNPAGFVIHEAIYGARPDVGAIFHTHTPAGVAVSTLARGLLPISQFALRFHGKVAYHDYEGATLIEGERERLGRTVADAETIVIILRNHGLLTVGPSVPHVFSWMYFLDRACQVQIESLQTGEEIVTLSDEVCEVTARQYAGLGEEDMDERLALEWEALVRLIEDETPSYKQ